MLKGSKLENSQPRQSRFSLSARLRSARHAGNGLRLLVVDQHNARVHVVIALMVIAAGWLLGLNHLEWGLILLLIGWVLSIEALNSALEYLCDKVSPTQDSLIGKAKDVAAAAVLISAVSAAVIGLLIFVPKVLQVAGY